MPNELRPSGVRVTGLLSDLIHTARVRLTFIYATILTAILIASSTITYAGFSSRFEQRIVAYRTQHAEIVMENELPEQARTELVIVLVFVNGVLLLSGIVLSYWWAGLTLEPIQSSYDRQRRLLSDSSHELRTPLAILQTDLENELREAGGTARNRKGILSNLEEVERMSTLVKDLLLLSRIDSEGAERKKLAFVDMRDIAESAAERLRAYAKKHHITLTVAPLPSKPLRVIADRELLLQAVSNVLRNGVDYNVDRGSVTVEVFSQRGLATIRVSDTGIGISKEDMTHIFDRFYRADKSRSRERGGSGLGLSIVRTIFNRFNGSVSVRSSLGKGTRFDLTLPMRGSS